MIHIKKYNINSPKQKHLTQKPGWSK